MSVTDSITQARAQGANDDQIISEIAKQNPEKSTSIMQARSVGADSSAIINEIIKQNTRSGVTNNAVGNLPVVKQLSEAGIGLGTGIAKAGLGVAKTFTKGVGFLILMKAWSIKCFLGSASQDMHKSKSTQFPHL